MVVKRLSTPPWLLRTLVGGALSDDEVLRELLALNGGER